MSNENDKATLVWEKFKLSISFPVSLLWHCIVFFGNSDDKKEEWWKDKIHRVRKEYDRNNFEVIGYSFFSALFISFILCIIIVIISMISRYGLSLSCWNLDWGWNINLFLSILLAVGALFVSIIIALILRKKEVENGKEFFEQLYLHINYLEHISNEEQERELYIISPNINIGIGGKLKMGKFIKENKKIKFKFICKSIDIKYLRLYGTGKYSSVTGKHDFFNQMNESDSKMLKYLYDRYQYENAAVQKLDDVINELIEIMDYPNFEFIPKYDEIFKENMAGEKKVAGYLSTKECLLGRYIDKIEGKDGDVSFRGESVTSFEFIDIVKTYILEVEKKTIKNGEQFMEHLKNHIHDLNNNIPLKKGKKHELCIISPNITIGYGVKENLLTVIANNANIQFTFICKTIGDNSLERYDNANDKEDFLKNVDKTTDSMLSYMYERYYPNKRQGTFEESIEVLKQILEIEKKGGNVKIIQIYDGIYIDEDRNTNVGGYLSDKECVLGIYKNIDPANGKISYTGETITSPKVINIIKANILRNI